MYSFLRTIKGPKEEILNLAMCKLPAGKVGEAARGEKTHLRQILGKEGQPGPPAKF